MSHKTIRTLVVKFNVPLQPWEVSAFRGAIIEKVGREHLLFNHHISDDKFLYRYPLIQYKSIAKKPGIVCLGDGVEEIHKLFNKSTWEIDLKGKKVNLDIDDMRLSNFTLNLWDKSFSYRLHNWLALSEKNFSRIKSLQTEMDQLEMLEKILIGNILSFAKGIEWDITNPIKVRIHQILRTKNLKYKNTHLLGFDVEFSTNVSLPLHLGLGKGVSHGFGTVWTRRN